jgi:hypothetical protein
MGNGGSGPGSLPDYGSDGTSPQKSQGRKSTDIGPATSANKRSQAGSEVGAERVDPSPEDSIRLQGGYEIVQAGKVKVPGEDVIDGANPGNLAGYDAVYGDVKASVNHITSDVDYPETTRANDGIEQV